MGGFCEMSQLERKPIISFFRFVVLFRNQIALNATAVENKGEIS